MPDRSVLMLYHTLFERINHEPEGIWNRFKLFMSGNFALLAAYTFVFAGHGGYPGQFLRLVLVIIASLGLFLCYWGW